MRNLFVIGMLLVAAFMAGWFQINREGDRTTIEINRSEIRGDARKAIERGRDFLDHREQQYADQQQPPQYDEQGRQIWPQEQVAVQQDAWGAPQQPVQQQFDPRGNQQYNDQIYYPQDQQYANPQPQNYAPITR